MNLVEVTTAVLKEFDRGVSIHGDWSEYTTDQMLAQIIHELMVEAGEAEKVGDITGEHGMIRELIQVAACSIKAAMVLSKRHGVAL